MAGSGRERHRDRESERLAWSEPGKPPTDRVFRITDEQRQDIARALRYIDGSRVALEAQHNAENREIIRELRASADRIYDLLNDLEEVGE